MFTMHWFVYYSLGLLIYLNGRAKGGIIACTQNENCDEGSVCYEGVCQKCLDCRLVFKNGKSCKLDFSDCGDCLEGYEIEKFEDLTNVPSDFKHSKYLEYCKPAKAGIQSEFCLENKSCPKNSYCFLGSCVKCFDCNLYNRLPPESGCAKQVDECGSCQTGFYEVPVTTYSNSKPCVTNISNNTKEFKVNDTDEILLYCSVTIALISYCVSIFLFVYKIIRKKKVFKSIELKQYLALTSSLLDSKKHTDLYEPSAPALPQNETGSNCYHVPQTFHYFQETHSKLNEDEHLDVEFEEVETQNARIYQNPTAEYYEYDEELDGRINTPLINNNTNGFGLEESNEPRLSSPNEQVRNDLGGREEESPIREENTSNLPVVEGEENTSAASRNDECNEGQSL